MKRRKEDNKDNLISEIINSNSTVEKILLIVGAGLSLTSPRGARFIAHEFYKYFASKRTSVGAEGNIGVEESKTFSNAIYLLKRRKFIKVEEINGKIVISLTEKGVAKRISYDFKRLKVKKLENWDGKWRMVMFDIPEGKKHAREALRTKLKDMRFLQFQKSVWICPYPCEKEIDILAETLKVGRYITFLTAQIDEDGPLKEGFDL